MKRSFRTWFLGVTTLFAMMALAAATLAWFSSNRAVQTNTATARTGDETLELQISSTGGSSFQSVETAPVTQVNQMQGPFCRCQRQILERSCTHRLPAQGRRRHSAWCRTKPIIIMEECI